MGAKGSIGRFRSGRAIAALCAALALAACESGSQAKGSSAGSERVPVVVATAQRRDVPVDITAVGTVEPFTTVSVRSHVEGELSEVGAEEGQEVSPGQLLFAIDPRPFQAVLDQALANLARDEAQAQYANLEERRVGQLAERRITSKDELDQARSKAAALAASVKADRAAVETAQLRLDYCSIRSPIAGRMGEVLVRSGNLVKENDSVLAVINQIKPAYVQFSVPESRLHEIRDRMAAGVLSVTADPPGPAPPVTGKLQFVDNAVDVTTGTVALKALFENRDERLWPGQFATVILTIATQKDAVTVPAHAVETGQSGPYVYVVGADDRVESRPVQVGIATGDDVVIESGVAPGERVVTEGQIRLAPGLPVVVKQDAGGAGGAPSGASG